MATEKEIKLQAELDKLEKQLQEEQKTAPAGQTADADALKRKIERLERQLELEQQIAVQRKESLKSLGESIGQLAEERKLTQDKKEAARLDLQIAQKRLEFSKKLLEDKQKSGIADDKELEKAAKMVAKREEELKSLKLQNKELEKQEEASKKIEESKQKILSFVNKITGGYSEQIRSLFTMDGLMTSFGTMVKDVVTTNEKLVATTGQLSNISAEAVGNLSAYGVTYRDFGESFGALYTSMASFSNLSKQTQNDLTSNAAKMANLGVDAGTTAQNFNILTKALGVNATEVAGINDKLAKAAFGAGIAPAKMLKEFGSAMPQLAAHGKQAINVFIDLQKQAKSLGMEMSTLMGIVGDGFDTFEGAAEKAGKLNAILGGDYLNSVEMLNATESERVEILKRSFEQSGRNWDSLDRFERKAIATSLGIKDMNEAGKLFGNTSAEMRSEMAKQAASQTKLDEAQKNSADSMKQLQTMFYELLPAAQEVAKVIKGFIIFLAENKEIIRITLAVALLTKGLSMLTTVVNVAKGFMALFATTTTSTAAPVAAAGNSISGAILSIGEAAAASAIGLLALGGTIALIGVGIGAAALGVSKLVESFSKLSGEQVWAAVAALTAFTVVMGLMILKMFALAPAILAVSSAGVIGAPGLLALGAAIALIGAGIGAAAYGMSLLVKSISELVDKAANISNLIAISSAIKDISAAIMEMPDTKEFNAKVTTIKTVAETVSIAADKAPSLAPATQFVTAAKDYYIAQKESKAFDQDALVAAIRGIVPAGGITTGGLAAGTQVVIKIENGKDLIGMVMGRQAGNFNPV